MNKLIVTAFLALIVSGYTATAQMKSLVNKVPVKEEVKKIFTSNNEDKNYYDNLDIIKQFVDKKDDKYIPVSAFSTYKVFQPEKGRLNVNLK